LAAKEGATGPDRNTVSRWERGLRWPQPRNVRLLCRLFELPADRLGLVAESADRQELPAWESIGDATRFASAAASALEEVIRLTRRQLLAGSASVAATVASAAVAEPLERLAYALHHPERVDKQTITHLERVTVALERLEPMSDSISVVGLVNGHMDTLSVLLQGSLADTMRRSLCSLAGEAAGLAGWLRFIDDDSHGADAHFKIALEAAQAAEDRALGAYLMGRAACQPFYREEPHIRLKKLQGSFGFAARHGTPTTQAWLASLEAEAHALAGRTDDCLRALDHAERLMGRALDEDGAARPRVTFFDRVWLDGEKGVVLAKLGHHEAAQVSLHAALAALDPLWQKHRTWLLAILAETYVAQGRPEDACRAGAAALTIATTVHADADLGLVRALRAELEPWRDQACVQQFDEQLRLARAS
jgi:transcriptional regulator with XRE-family HTH domain